MSSNIEELGQMTTDPIRYDYRTYTITITYRPKYRDFSWAILRTITLRHSDHAPTLESAKRAAEKYVNTIAQGGSKRR